MLLAISLAIAIGFDLTVLASSNEIELANCPNCSLGGFSMLPDTSSWVRSFLFKDGIFDNPVWSAFSDSARNWPNGLVNCFLLVDDLISHSDCRVMGWREST